VLRLGVDAGTINPMLVLASASPRRQELLRAAGISFTVQPADVDEARQAEESPQDCAERLAKEKAMAVWRTRPQDAVLGADTVVVVDNELLGKPSDGADAARMLRLLSGREHQVITGVCMVRAVSGDRGSGVSGAGMGSNSVSARASDGAARVQVGHETTLVAMHAISDEEIRDYVASGEPMDKAGAYAIQGMASRWIPRIVGDYGNVVGLPVALVYRMLRDKG
jgi:septum formation protein